MLNWGFIGTGGIARRVAQALSTPTAQTHARLVAVLSRQIDSARTFAADFPTAEAFDQTERFLANPTINAVYVATPHPFHAEAVRMALAAGKHVLCEKPLGMNHAQVVSCVEMARAHKRFLAEAFTYRVAAQTQKLRALIEGGAIGKSLHIEAHFVHRSERQPPRLLEKSLGGGALLDLGCYTTSLARMAAGADIKSPFAHAELAGAHAQFSSKAVDTFAAAFLGFENGPSATLTCGFSGQYLRVLRVLGTDGRIEMSEPYWANGQIQLFHGQEEQHTVFDFTDDKTDRFARLFADIDIAVAQGNTELPALSWADMLDNAALLDAWRAHIGLSYEADGNTK